ncbi:MAG: ribosomal protein S18-alanine N-acetyltransferase [Burkholderiales bacterium]|nr:ribosomal protein S18-alanine N-acetyltransferase [Burkholderiales bacterium]
MSMPRFVDRPLTEADIPAVMEMEALACLHSIHAWTDDNYRSSIRAGYWARVRCEADTGRILAVCVAMDGLEEMHLLNIAVDQSLHGKGVAQDLMRILYELCLQRGAKSLWLEVRPTNERARRLYLREGFEPVGVRKNYYPAPHGREDAVVMRRLIQATEGASDALV